jgi:predicted nucleotidyltransferase
MKYTESQLEGFTKPISDTENQRCENMINMVKDAIQQYYNETRNANINLTNYEIFLQGSYANNTNVKQNSDVDICVMYKNVFHYEMLNGYSLDSSYSDSNINYYDIRNLIKQALIKKFGSSRIQDKNKAIRILSNTYTTDADVVVAFQYRKYGDATNYQEGIYYKALDGTTVINYPKIHMKNGNSKNNSTNYMYKKMVRIFKKIMYDMQDDNVNVSKEAKGFVLECMIYNIPNDKIYQYMDTKYSTNLINMINTFINDSMNYWKEVNEIKYLFGIEKGKDEKYYKEFITAMKRYINE